MECKMMQGRLITDYLDGELSAEESLKIQQHMEACTACRELMGVVSETMAASFKGLKELQPDPIVWRNVRGMIAAEEERSEGWLKKVERILTPVLQPLAAFRLIFVTTMVLMVIVLAKWPFNIVEPTYAYMEDQMTFMGELQSGNSNVLSGDLNGNEYEMPFEENVR